MSSPKDKTVSKYLKDILKEMVYSQSILEVILSDTLLL